MPRRSTTRYALPGLCLMISRMTLFDQANLNLIVIDFPTVFKLIQEPPNSLWTSSALPVPKQSRVSISQFRVLVSALPRFSQGEIHAACLGRFTAPRFSQGEIHAACLGRFTAPRFSRSEIHGANCQPRTANYKLRIMMDQLVRKSLCQKQ